MQLSLLASSVAHFAAYLSTYFAKRHRAFLSILVNLVARPRVYHNSKPVINFLTSNRNTRLQLPRVIRLSATLAHCATRLPMRPKAASYTPVF